VVMTVWWNACLWERLSVGTPVCGNACLWERFGDHWTTLLNDTILCDIIFKEKVDGKINIEKGDKKIYKEREEWEEDI
jgi:hypothetical protein